MLAAQAIIDKCFAFDIGLNLELIYEKLWVGGILQDAALEF